MAEKHPLGVMMWEDLTNGFNCATCLSVDKGLIAMPPQLQWLRRAFHAFYSEDVPFFFARDGEAHVIVSATGSMQVILLAESGSTPPCSCPLTSYDPSL
jgi:hypothetical protein